MITVHLVGTRVTCWGSAHQAFLEQRASNFRDICPICLQNTRKSTILLGLTPEHAKTANAMALEPGQGAVTLEDDMRIKDGTRLKAGLGPVFVGGG